MSITWVLVANSSEAQLYEIHRARLFQANGNIAKELKQIRKFQHEESRMRNAELVSDRFGRYQYQGSFAGHGAYEHTSPKEESIDKFARTLAHELDLARIQNLYDDLIIVANPHFKGLIRLHLNIALSRMVSSTIEKDYTQLPLRQLAQHLQTKI